MTHLIPSDTPGPRNEFSIDVDLIKKEIQKMLLPHQELVGVTARALFLVLSPYPSLSLSLTHTHTISLSLSLSLARRWCPRQFTRCTTTSTFRWPFSKPLKA